MVCPRCRPEPIFRARELPFGRPDPPLVPNLPDGRAQVRGKAAVGDVAEPGSEQGTHVRR